MLTAGQRSGNGLSLPQLYLILDYETRSECELKKTSSYEYARHKSTQILCVAWKLGTLEQLRTAPTQCWSPALPSSYGELKRALLDPRVILVAHNAAFEKVITEFVLSRLIHDDGIKNIDPSRWICTMAMASALAFPRKLEAVCAALKLDVQKDMEGHKLMMKMSKPRPVWKKWVESGKPWRPKGPPKQWYQTVSELKRLMAYCVTDIDAEVELFLTIPRLSSDERKVWLLDQKINRRGFSCDRPLVKKILRLVKEELALCEKRAAVISGGSVERVSKRDEVLRWLKSQDIILFNLQKKTVEDTLASGLVTGKAAEMLRLRLAASKSSTAKFDAFLRRSVSDGRIRQSLVYCGASTGRFGGAGVQPHNLPTQMPANPEFVCQVLMDPTTDLEMVRFLFGDPLALFSSLLRSMIIASPGKKLFGGDFNAIEVRVLFWLAGHLDGLEAFRTGRDLYKEIATKIYKKILKEITKAERDVGKRAVLGCGFGMGPPKFFETCKQYGQEIDEDLAATAVRAYRETHAPVPKLWKNLERAAIAAVRHPGKTFSTNKTKWTLQGKYLYCELPSGRKLTYYGPQIRMVMTPWGEKRPALFHWDIHPKTKKWVFAGTYGGKLTENVVQAVARDLMVASMFRAEAAGYDLLFTVHDELLAEKEAREASVRAFEKLMAQTPSWGKDIPIAVEGWSGERFRK